MDYDRVLAAVSDLPRSTKAAHSAPIDMDLMPRSLPERPRRQLRTRYCWQEDPAPVHTVEMAKAVTSIQSPPGSAGSRDDAVGRSNNT